MERLLGAVATVGDTKIRSDDDMVDRLNHRYTVFILVVFSIVVSTKQYVGEPIVCWCPAEFTDNHEDFTNKLCWVTNTYYVPINEKKIPEEHDPRMRIGYYQWVPLILLSQACLFYLPAMAWRFLSNKAGVDVQNLVDAALTLQHGAYMDKRLPMLAYLVRHLDRYLSTAREAKYTCTAKCKRWAARHMLVFCGRRYGNYVTAMYLCIKLVYIANVLGQLFLLNAFLGDNYHLYGVEVVRGLLGGAEWSSSARFPRVTLCDFHVRQLGNIQRHTVQCVLPINLFTEKIYIFVWFWFVFVTLVTCINFVTWLCRAHVRRSKVGFVLHHLGAVVPSLSNDDKLFAGRFVDKYLKQDGVLVLRLMGTNANHLAVAEVLRELWLCYRLRCGMPNNPLDPSAPILEPHAAGLNGAPPGRGNRNGREEV